MPPKLPYDPGPEIDGSSNYVSKHKVSKNSSNIKTRKEEKYGTQKNISDFKPHIALKSNAKLPMKELKNKEKNINQINFNKNTNEIKENIDSNEYNLDNISKQDKKEEIDKNAVKKQRRKHQTRLINIKSNAGSVNFFQNNKCDFYARVIINYNHVF